MPRVGHHVKAQDLGLERLEPAPGVPDPLAQGPRGGKTKGRAGFFGGRADLAIGQADEGHGGSSRGQLSLEPAQVVPHPIPPHPQRASDEGDR